MLPQSLCKNVDLNELPGSLNNNRFPAFLQADPSVICFKNIKTPRIKLHSLCFMKSPSVALKTSPLLLI